MSCTRCSRRRHNGYDITCRGEHSWTADRKLAHCVVSTPPIPIRTPSAMARFDRATRSSTRATSSRSDTRCSVGVRDEGQSVTETAAAFGVSRQGFYASASAFAAEGLPGLVPERPGPRRAQQAQRPRGRPRCVRDRSASLASLGGPRSDRGEQSGSASTGAVSSGRWRAEKGGSARGLRIAASAETLARTYEALRAEATGER